MQASPERRCRGQDNRGVRRGGGSGGKQTSWRCPDLLFQFQLFSKFGESGSDGSQITLTQSDKWLRQAKVIDGWNVTTTDTAIAFRKISRGSTRLSYPGWLVFLRELAETKKLPLPQVWARLEQVFLLFILGVFWLKILGLRQPVSCTFFCVANLVSQTWSVFPLICTQYIVPCTPPEWETNPEQPVAQLS